MSAPPEILQLVDRFDRNLDAYRSGEYNETQLRREFLDPFFTALGWDVENKQGYAGAYKHVIHEDAIKVGGATKAPDYCFRIGGTRKFFVEAKKPSVNLKDEISPAYQLRRYAWSAKLPLSILTDFDEFAVYDCRVKPVSTDAAATTRTLYLQFKEYPEHWEEIASIFSREAVLKGSFDKYAESTKAKKGTAEVDDAFLKEIEAWRDTLARTIALRNTELTQRELNFAVQRTIDRMIFLRICEDRGIETYGALMALLNGEHVYKRLCELFHRADEKYNSGLFHFRKEKDRLEQPDELTLGLSIDDKPLKEIIRNLYYPDSPYEFSVLPADILGQVYEQFLGKVIRLTPGHRAVVEDKPEVKKAGGVYYTPTYIVDYIVKNTVGKLLGVLTPSPTASEPPLSQFGRGDGGEVKKQPTPKQVSKLRILDPACGSGSFLIGAYQYLLDWHRDWYVNDGPEKWATGRSPVLYQVSGGDWRLTTTERKRILLNNIYGVDIDPQAVEVTKLSLLLKVLEGENEQTISRQLRMFRERALPDLGSNIKCGNSLIGPDFYEGKQLSLMDDEERLRINVFDWKKEFAEIFREESLPLLGGDKEGVSRGEISKKETPPRSSPKRGGGPARLSPDAVDRDAGGFDAVIGNPPYVLLQEEFRDDRQLEYFRSSFEGASYKIDTYHLFIEQGLNLCRVDGCFSMITPANFLTNNHLAKLRRIIVERATVQSIVIVDGGVFRGISVDNAVFVFRPGKPTGKDFEITHANIENQRLSQSSVAKVSPKRALADEHVLFTGTTETTFSNLWERILAKTRPLGDLADVNFGKQLRDRSKFQQDVIEVSSIRTVPKTHVPCYTGRDVIRYFLRWGNLACLNDDVARSGGCWDAAKHEAKNKLVTRQIGRFPDFALDTAGWHCLNTMFMVNLRDAQLNPHYVLGILNSKLMHALWLDRFFDQRRTFPKIKGTYLKQLPIWNIDSSNSADKSRHDRMVEMVEEMLALYKQLASAKTEHEKTALQRQIDATDKQIDQLVYELYGITEEEQKIIEETNA